MRLLHTSDWHLGRGFHGVGMLAAQRRFVGQLIDTVRTEQVDVLLLAGDVYDRALPGVDVVELLDSTLAQLRAAGVRVVLTSGNHDSATRLGFAGKVLEGAEVHLRTRLADAVVPILVPLDGESQLAIYGIPFLEPRMVADQLGVSEPIHFQVTQAAIQGIRADLEQRRSAGTGSVFSVVLAHTFASGGITSESERALSIGGLGVVPLDLFHGFDYVALGHLHGRQTLSHTVRYSGSPLPYSFSEARHHKGAWLVEFDGDGLGQVRAVDWAPERKLAVLRGSLEHLLTNPEFTWAEEAYVQAVVTDDERPAQAMERLRQRFPLTLVLNFEPENPKERTGISYATRIGQAKDSLALCCGFMEHVRGRRTSEVEEAELERVLNLVTSTAVTS